MIPMQTRITYNTKKIMKQNLQNILKTFLKLISVLVRHWIITIAVNRSNRATKKTLIKYWSKTIWIIIKLAIMYKIVVQFTAM